MNNTLYFTFIKKSHFQKMLRYEVLTAQRRYATNWCVQMPIVGTWWRTSPSTSCSKKQIGWGFWTSSVCLVSSCGVATAISGSDLLRLFSLGLSQEQSVYYPSTWHCNSPTKNHLWVWCSKPCLKLGPMSTLFHCPKRMITQPSLTMYE